MATQKTKTRTLNRTLYERAKEQVALNPDGSVVELTVEDALAYLLVEPVPKDPMIEARRKSKAIIEALGKLPNEEDDDDGDQLRLKLGGESYKYDPRRLIKDDEGNIIEEDKAPLSFILAELARSAEHTSRVNKWNSRKALKAVHFQRWIAAQQAAKRDEKELTWGVCARETGALVEPKARKD